MQKCKINGLIYDEALKLFYKKASMHNIDINQKILNEFYQGLDNLINNLNKNKDVNIIGEYIYNFIHKYSQTNKSA